jgi:hypothetical protein
MVRVVPGHDGKEIVEAPRSPRIGRPVEPVRSVREPLRVLPGDRPPQLVARQGKARQTLGARRLAPLFD